jgi:hypothetical protein
MNHEGHEGHEGEKQGSYVPFVVSIFNEEHA